MRWLTLLFLLLVALALVGSDCNQDLFAPIICDDNEECENACAELCAESGDDVMSAVCDANGFCDCLCMAAEEADGAILR